jgi:hypothetical protein
MNDKNLLALSGYHIVAFSAYLDIYDIGLLWFCGKSSLKTLLSTSIYRFVMKYRNMRPKLFSSNIVDHESRSNEHMRTLRLVIVFFFP